MKGKMLICLTLLLVMMSLLTSGLEDQSLTCYTDYIDNLTCEWDISLLKNRPNNLDSCFLSTTCNDEFYPVQTVQGGLLPIETSKPELLKAKLSFQNECLGYVTVSVHLKVECGGRTVAEITEFDLLRNVKLNPPEKPQVDGRNVSWRLGSPQSGKITHCKFEMQFKALDAKWKEVEPVYTEQFDVLLPEERLVQGGRYEVRVRSSPKYVSEFWSEWSPSTQWTSTVGRPPPEETMPWLFPSVTGSAVLVIVAIILLIIFHLHPVTCSLKSPGSNPFDELYFKHDGDFKAWLGPIVAPESFLQVDTEKISPMELCKIQDPDTSSINVEESKRKGFSNSTYFLSQSSKCEELEPLEPCSNQCPYGPPGGGATEEKGLLTKESSLNSDSENESSFSGPLETSSSYKHLQKLRLDVQSPDSGFAAGSDQDSQEESGSEGLPSPPVVDVQPIKDILPCPIPHAPHVAGFPHLLFLSSGQLEWGFQGSNHLEILPPSMSTNVLMPNPGVMDCSGMLEPASEDYMPVRNVQE
ncbi:uncharacterized protein [Hoplias malabaricus]|uniref:uncharacterized protein n=1 Tax=Hoplias malabaricus TaxID=27720 RepID=UPI003462F306